jgi:hypothetical protein
MLVAVRLHVAWSLSIARPGVPQEPAEPPPPPPPVVVGGGGAVVVGVVVVVAVVVVVVVVVAVVVVAGRVVVVPGRVVVVGAVVVRPGAVVVAGAVVVVVPAVVVPERGGVGRPPKPWFAGGTSVPFPGSGGCGDVAPPTGSPPSSGVVEGVSPTAAKLST